MCIKSQMSKEKKGKKMYFTLYVMSIFFSLVFMPYLAFASATIVSVGDYSTTTLPNEGSSCSMSGTYIFTATTTPVDDFTSINPSASLGGWTNCWGVVRDYALSAIPDDTDVWIASPTWSGGYVSPSYWYKFTKQDGVVYALWDNMRSQVELSEINQTLQNNPVSIVGTYINANTYNRMQFQFYSDYIGDYVNYYYDLTLANGTFSFLKNVVLPYNANYTLQARLIDTSSSTSYVYSDWSNEVEFGLNDIELRVGSTTAELFYDKASTSLRIYYLTGYTDGISTTDTYNIGACSPFQSNFPYMNTNFSVSDCLEALFVPNEHDQARLFVDTKETVLSMFPVGYITEFVSIVSTSSTSSLPVFSATLPAEFGNSNGTSISLDLSHSIDYVLNATSSHIGSSTMTIFEATYPYWEIFVWICCGLYVLTRIFSNYFSIPDYSGGVSLYRDLANAKIRKERSDYQKEINKIFK